jgi:tRNA pseudouridine38-40 synthase
MEKVLGEPVTIHGCGRTDTGVHASQYFFHIDLNELPGPDFIFIINQNLPEDIRIFDYLIVPHQFNAQKTAETRLYRYFIHIIPDPFIQDISTYIDFHPDEDKITEAMGLLIGKNDFRAFTLTPDKHKSTICHIKSARCYRAENKHQICLEFRADHFTRSMIRQLVDELLQVGAGKRSLVDFRRRLFDLKPYEFAKLAYPQGLFLSAVEYPGLHIKRMTKEPIDEMKYH